MSNISPLSARGHEPYEPQLLSLPFPSLQEEKKIYADLVQQYVAAPNSEEAEKVNQSLVNRYKIDLGLRQYKGAPLPVNPQKKVESVAMIAFTLFEMDRTKIDQSSLYSLSGGVFTKVFARTIMLIERTIEIIRALSPGTQADMQKTYLKKAESLHQNAEKQFGELENRMENPLPIRALLKESGSLLADADKALKKKSFSEADFYLLAMSDKMSQIKEGAQGIFSRLLESMKVGKQSSYDCDLQDVKAISLGLNKLFIDYDQRVFQRAPWQALKAEADVLQKEEQKAEGFKGTPSMEASLLIFDLRLKAKDLDQKVIDFLLQNVENAFDLLK
ncbi:MAG: hypothetical protein WCN87_04240 [Chlamydiota bacterium]